MQQPPVSQPSNYFTARGMAHANDPRRIHDYETRAQAAVADRARKTRASLQARADAIRGGHVYPRTYMNSAITDAEALDLYNRITYQDKPLVKARRPRGEDPLSFAQRKAINDARKDAFKADLNRIYTDQRFLDERDKELAYALGRKNARQLQQLPKPKKTPEERAKELLKRQYRHLYPNAILDERVEALVKEFDGDDYNNPEHAEWVGQYPQTMSQEEREKAARTFAELTGTLGWMPTYDPRLTTVESAKKVYSPEDYDISAYDMDMNDFTPANVIIRKKFEINPVTGERIDLPPNEWKIVAANGYRLTDPSAQQQYSRLKTMAYYKLYPTASARQAYPFSQFVNSSVFAPKVKSALGAVKKVVKDIILAPWNRFMARKGNPKVPILFTLLGSAPNFNRVGIIFSMSPIAMNSLVSDVARLWAAYELYPLAAAKRAQMDAQIANYQKAPSYLYTIFQQYLQDCGHAPPAGKTDAFYSWWIDSHLIEPRLETVLHRDEYLHSCVNAVANEMAATLARGDMGGAAQLERTIKYYVDLSIFAFMNYYAPQVAKLLQTTAPNVQFHPVSYTFSIMDGSGTDDADLDGVIRGTIQPFPITPIKNTDLLIKHPTLTYWGTNYIEHATQVGAAAQPPPLPPPYPAPAPPPPYPVAAATTSGGNPFATSSSSSSSSSSYSTPFVGPPPSSSSIATAPKPPLIRPTPRAPSMADLATLPPPPVDYTPTEMQRLDNIFNEFDPQPTLGN